MTTEEFTSFNNDGPRSRNKFDSIVMKDSYIPARTIGTDYTYHHKIVWKNAIGFLILHLLAFWGFCKFITGCVSLKTTIWSKEYYFVVNVLAT